MRVLMLFPVGVAEISQTTNLYQVWGNSIRLALVERGHHVDVWPIGSVRDMVGRISQLNGGDYDFSVLIYYSGEIVAQLIKSLRVRVGCVVYFNESSAAEYCSNTGSESSPDYYYQASLSSLRAPDEEKIVRVDGRWRLVPPFRTLSAPIRRWSEKRGVVVNGPLPPRYINKFSDLLANRQAFYVDPRTIFNELRPLTGETGSFIQLLSASVGELRGFQSNGLPLPFGHPDWTVEPLEDVENLEPVPMAQLAEVLDRSRHYIVTHLESYGGLVLDALSKRCVVHYPVPPIVYKSSLVAMRRENGYVPSRHPNMKPFGSLGELANNVRDCSWQSAGLAELDEVASMMVEDAARSPRVIQPRV